MRWLALACLLGSCHSTTSTLRTSHGIVIRTNTTARGGQCEIPNDVVRETGLAFEATLWAFDYMGLAVYESVSTCRDDFLYVCWVSPGSLNGWDGLQQGHLLWVEITDPLYRSALVHEFAHYLIESECTLSNCSPDPSHRTEAVWGPGGAVLLAEQIWAGQSGAGWSAIVKRAGQAGGGTN
jgi:hypothetical protein